MKMLQSDWLSYHTVSAIGVQWLKDMMMFSCFCKVLGKDLEILLLILFPKGIKE